MWTVRLTALLVALCLVPAAAAAAAVPAVHAHRGGPMQLMTPAFAEGSMPAFADAWGVRRAVLELDVKLSEDRVPVVIHDDTLDRTTQCTGPVAERTWADLRASCPTDVLGIDPYRTAKADPPVPLVRLREVLNYARETGAVLNIEIKNIPGENDFDPTPAYARTVIAAIREAEVPLGQVIVQSFWPPNLDVAEQELAGAQTALLTLQQANGGGPEFAASRGYEWWSPNWPAQASDIQRAHGLGVKVVPWTIDTTDGIRAAAAAGADAVITNDPVLARRALGLPDAAIPLPGGPPATTREQQQAAATRARTRLRACGSLRGARRILANRRAGSCRTARGIVRHFLRRGCARRWRCTGRRTVRLRSRGRLVRFERPRVTRAPRG